MAKARVYSIDTSSQLRTGLHLDLCRELAVAFRQLCRVVCDRYGREGEKLIRDVFLSDVYVPDGDAERGVENSIKRVNAALIRLLASKSMGHDHVGKHGDGKSCPS